MPYGEMRFEDEEEFDNSRCEFCGRTDGHQPDCIVVENYDIGANITEEE